MKRSLLAVCWLCLLVPGWAQSEIDSIFREWNNGPGGAVGVVQGDRLVVKRGYGYADLAAHTRIDSATNFDLASVSKQFCSTAVLMLAQRGRLRLDDRLDRYLDGLPAYAAGVRLRNLLNMTSGLPDYDDSQPASPKSLVAGLRAGEAAFAPGSRYEYVNLNYALLTFVVERAGAQPMGAFLQQQIFGPLKMKNTHFLSRKDQKIDNRATGYRRAGKEWVVSRNDVPGVCDGNVFSSVEDLARWEIDWLKGSSLLDGSWRKRAWTEGLRSSGYGYGFEIDRHAGWRRISHTGSWNGTSTYVALYPERKLGVIVLSNREEEDVYALGEQVEDLYLHHN